MIIIINIYTEREAEGLNVSEMNTLGQKCVNQF